MKLKFSFHIFKNKISLKPVQYACELVENNGTSLYSSLTSPAVMNPLAPPFPLVEENLKTFR